MASNKVLTIDITNESVTIIEATASAKKGTMIHNAVIFETPENSYEDGFIKDASSLASAIRDQLSANGISNKNAIFVLTSTKIVNREVMVPQVGDKKLKGLIKANATEYFPVNIEDYIVSHHVLETVAAEKQCRVLVVAAPVNMVRSYYDLASMAGLKVQALDYVGNSMLQLIKTQTSASSTTMVIQLGSESSILNIVKGDTLLLQRTVPYGTNAVVAEVMEERNCDAATAMTLLQNERLITVDFDDNAPTGAFRYLMNNIGRVMDYYASKNPDKPIDDVYLSGDGALIRGIEGLFKIQLNVTTKVMDNLYNVKFDSSINMQIYNPVYLIASIGAALEPMNFELNESKSKDSAGLSLGDSKIPLMVLVIVVVACGAGIVFTSMQKSNAQNEVDSLNQKITAIQDVEQIISQYEASKAKVDDIQTLYNMTAANNENLLNLITELEKRMPNGISISNIAANEDGINFTAVASDKKQIAVFTQQLKQIGCIVNPFVPKMSRTAAVDADGNEIADGVTYEFSATCNYADIASTTEAQAQ